MRRRPTGQTQAQAQAGANSLLVDPSMIPSAARSPAGGGIRLETDASKYKEFQCLYPIYFDATRTRADGRRVSKSLAVASPLATEIVSACAALQLPTVLEMGKTHPKDWANPGRVKIDLNGVTLAAGQLRRRDAPRNKHHLLLLVAKHLRAHPAADDAPALRMRLAGVPPQHQPEAGKPWPRPAVPRGWKVGEFLPVVSPALTGGGVSENLWKDMMKEMQGGGDPMAALMNAAGGGGSSSSAGALEEKKAKKDKKGKGK